MVKILSENKLFYFTFLFFMLTGALWMILQSEPKIFLFINNFHIPLLDKSMPFLTFFGDGLFFAIVVLILGFRKFRYLFIAFISFVFSSLIAQVLKRTLFSDAIRPKAFFEHSSLIHTIPGVDVYSFNSFPSGHTVTAFAIATLLTLFASDKRIAVFYCLLAGFVAYSRIYLSQHFFNDVYFGAWIGVLSSTLVYYWAEFPIGALKKYVWGERSFLYLKHSKGEKA